MVRAVLPAAIGVLAISLAPPLSAFAQDTQPSAPVASRKVEAAPAMPSAPIPYTQLYRKPAKPKPAASDPATARPAAAQTTGSAPQAPGAPRPAGGPSPAPTAAAPPPPPPQPGARLAAGQPLPPTELQGFVDGWVRSSMRRNHIAGVTVSVVQNGQVVLKKGYGFASLDPARAVDPDRTLFRIGSISKTFTWIALMKEVEAGRIRLDQPVNEYLPESLRLKDQGFEQPVRVINLLDHSAGFEDRALGHLFEDRFERVRPLDIYLRQERPKQVRAPGVLSSYSNYGAAVAGEVVATTARQPFEQLIETEILRPAGLVRTTFREPHPPKVGLPAPMPPELVAGVSDAFRWRGGAFQHQPYEYIEQIGPAGAASSTAGDMARYMLLLLANGSLDGATVFSPATAQAFRTPIQKAPEGINGWAHGFMIRTLPGGHQGYGHGGATLSFFSDLVVVPDLSLGVFISTNTAGGGELAGRFASDLVREFYVAPKPFPRAGSPELAARRDVFRGHYVATRRPYSGLESFVMRMGPAGVDIDVSPDGKLVLASFGQATAWAPDGSLADGRFVGLEDDRRLDFDVDGGRAASFVGDDNSVTYERVSAWKSPAVLMLLAGLAAVATLATLIGLLFRRRRDLRQSDIQRRASIVQSIQAGLWLTAFTLFGLFFIRAVGDVGWVMYGWPNPLLIVASACALVAASLTVLSLAVLPGVWSGGRRLDSWNGPRKFAFTVTVAIYAAFSVLLGLSGALLPWSG